jgi:predicted ATPase
MEYLIIKNFKCFHDVEIPINNLTIFAGANGNGKSTAIQALLYLRRTVEHCAKWNKKIYVYTKSNRLNVELNGAYCLALGNSDQVLTKDSGDNSITLGLDDKDKKFHVQYQVEEDKLFLTPNKVDNQRNKESKLFIQEFYYLNAERIGPRIKQDIKFYDYPNTGFQGELTAQLLGDTNFNYSFKVEDKRIFENTDKTKKTSPRLIQQVNAWLNDLMPGVEVTASYNTDTLSAQIRINNHFTKNDPVIAPNIGFGISYVLPILVTGLIAKEGSYMIVENPEAHLHPSAQSKIGRFLAMVANAGVKVIVETHSDHVINGIQIAAAKKEINPESVTVNFFNQTTTFNQPELESISINAKGELSLWPRGFFDQTQIDFAELFKLRKQ